jgi:hypothetical protein
MNNKTINNNNNFLKSLCPELIFNQEDKMWKLIIKGTRQKVPNKAWKNKSE